MEACESVSHERFKPLAGMKLVYDPCGVTPKSVKKHSCQDCHFCQHCSDSRCSTCMGGTNRPGPALKRKLSLAEQVRLYDKINESTR